MSQCKLCPVATYSSAEGVNKESGCVSCPPGKHSNATGKKDADDCKECDFDHYNGDEAAPTCSKCKEGQYQTEQGATSCNKCAAGSKVVGELGSRSCSACAIGQISPTPGAINCTDCLAGTYANEDKTTCFPCAPGKFAGQRASTECSPCGDDEYQNASKATSCIKVDPGFVVAEGGSASIQVPFGSKICDDSNGCTDNKAPFEACEGGTYGEIPPANRCLKCPAGFSSTKAATECQAWCVSYFFIFFLSLYSSHVASSPFSPFRLLYNISDKGKFNSLAGTSCSECLAGFFQDQSIDPSVSCQECQSGKEQPLAGSSSCSDIQGLKKADDCEAKIQYLNDTSNPAFFPLHFWRNTFFQRRK